MNKLVAVFLLGLAMGILVSFGLLSPGQDTCPKKPFRSKDSLKPNPNAAQQRDALQQAAALSDTQGDAGAGPEAGALHTDAASPLQPLPSSDFSALLTRTYNHIMGGPVAINSTKGHWISFASLFTSNTVLQRGLACVWGWGSHNDGRLQLQLWSNDQTRMVLEVCLDAALPLSSAVNQQTLVETTCG